MKIKSVFSHSFERFGRVIKDLDTTEFVKTLNNISPKPGDTTIYEPSSKELEALKITEILKDTVYGGMSIQAGYCNGSNTKLNSFECHIGSELNIPCDDIILLVAPIQAVKQNKIHSDTAQAFRVPKGTIVQLYETTLHFAPCNNVVNGKDMGGFRVGIILLKGTNTPKDSGMINNPAVFQKNKWLYAHPDSPQAKEGALIAVNGKNIDLIKNA